MTLVGLLVYVLVLALVLYLVRLIFASFNTPAPWPTVIIAIIAVAAVLDVLGRLGFLESGPHIRLR